MPKSNAATVIDLDAFRQRKQQERASAAPPQMLMNFAAQPMFVPMWVCWVPAWAPIVG